MRSIRIYKVLVNRLPVDPGPAAWNELLSVRKDVQQLKKTETADLLIIGAGFAGLSAAARAVQLDPNLNVVVLDAKRLAEGPAGRNSGFMIDLPHNLTAGSYESAQTVALEEIALNRHGIDFARQMASQFQIPEEAFNPVGRLTAAVGSKGIAKNATYAKSLQDISEPFEILDEQEMCEMTGGRFYRQGLHTPGAVVLQPALYIRSIGKGLKKKGVRIFEESPVLELSKTKNWVARTPRGSVEAPLVVLAVNGHLESFGFYSRNLMHVFTYASMTRKLTKSETRKLGGVENWGITPADPMGATVRRIAGTGGDRIVVRNRFTYDPTLQISKTQLRRITNRQRASFDKRFPVLTNVSMEYQWSGRLCLTRNHVSAFGKLDDGLFSACAQNGLGTAKGTLHGKLAAELALGQKSKFVKLMGNEAAPTQLPPEPVAYIGANATLLWQHLKAGSET